MIRAFLAVSALLLVGAFAPAALAPVQDAAITEKGFPKKLSDYGFFAVLPEQVPADGVQPYVLNAALFSDKAEKRRFMYVPAGQEVSFASRDGLLQLPVGSALIKTFGYENEAGVFEPIETRLLLHRANGWLALPYIWDEDGQDATLKVTGGRLEIEAPVGPDGARQMFTYSVPNKNQCKGCHALGGEVTPIGPKLRNLNNGASDSSNQIIAWREAGILPNRFPDHPIMPRFDTKDAPIGERARAYLDINCAHCHNRQGPASNSGLYLTYQESNDTALGLYKRPVAAGRGSGNREFAIHPGQPEASIMLYRMDSTDPGIAMPELGRSLIDDQGVALVREWIASLEGQSDDKKDSL
ncbi:SO2930 family diheme c-type cytochrome [Alterisphingorhabdus coralli]|uniref:SO2930 family diheme c-type cytochrome n=1 Tax=Alterisphingorhabdus coralli TaxID=3071408 RepID=A0AA97I2U0_9SPHN|nr:SO2930 family diheme c-type cytochrome [Parasphingorhabdus sp. SCSIO 66989]WOE76055.1 SO2930 family diheme c-type cytochrome [Parasphingorhabdus sp. SCSIO 66989]